MGVLVPSMKVKSDARQAQGSYDAREHVSVCTPELARGEKVGMVTNLHVKVHLHHVLRLPSPGEGLRCSYSRGQVCGKGGLS